VTELPATAIVRTCRRVYNELDARRLYYAGNEFAFTRLEGAKHFLDDVATTSPSHYPLITSLTLDLHTVFSTKQMPHRRNGYFYQKPADFFLPELGFWGGTLEPPAMHYGDFLEDHPHIQRIVFDLTKIQRKWEAHAKVDKFYFFLDNIMYFSKHTQQRRWSHVEVRLRALLPSGKAHEVVLPLKDPNFFRLPES
jgi:hypothetical protein